MEYLNFHQSHEYHKVAMTLGLGFIHGLENPKSSFMCVLSEHNKQIYDTNIYILTGLFNTILLCGRQDIPLRGHRDDNANKTGIITQKGNYIAILDEIAKYDTLLSNHFSHGQCNAKYTSKTIQNEMIGNYIRNAITSPIIQRYGFYSVIADEVTDTYSNQEILSLCLRYLDYDKNNLPTIKESFLDFSFLQRTTGEEISKFILQ